MGICYGIPISPTKDLKISAPDGIPIYRRDLKVGVHQTLKVIYLKFVTGSNYRGKYDQSRN